MSQKKSSLTGATELDPGVDLVPGGANRDLTYDDRTEFVRLATQARLGESADQILAMRKVMIHAGYAPPPRGRGRSHSPNRSKPLINSRFCFGYAGRCAETPGNVENVSFELAC